VVTARIRALCFAPFGRNLQLWPLCIANMRFGAECLLRWCGQSRAYLFIRGRSVFLLYNSQEVKWGVIAPQSALIVSSTTQWSRSSSAFLFSPVHFGAVTLSHSSSIEREPYRKFFRLLPAEQFHFWWRYHLVFSPFGWFANRTEISSGLSPLRLVSYDPEVEVLWGESRHENRRRNFWRHLWRDLGEFT
jgi:hypothetical protein